MNGDTDKGFTLIEALIAILVLSLGLLGVAAMQLNAMKSSHVSYQRSIATLSAQDAVERLWAELGDASNPGICPDATSVATINAAWNAQWSTLLPISDATPITATDCEYVISVQWSDERFDENLDGNIDSVSSLAYVVELPGRVASP
ncbi:type IV pilus modification protein PilV [Halomonas sp. M4R1S46]|uniref:type IV pilus modification protein PilV n=1 Tax=Halomonas sp. M4R1S46 TaxID=2982692 RepID=UPI0021E3F38C|nr:type IV pilus modification protein PilV [Halomonas sp. M4R1S46]UYG08081.1 type IV pilus modification protein PilV [Halomonas sp. M4R1S46]